MVGEALYSGVSTPARDLGAHIVAVFLFLAGVLLLTGASIAGRASGDARHGRRPRRRARSRDGGRATVAPPPGHRASWPTLEAKAVARRRCAGDGRRLVGSERCPDCYADPPVLEEPPTLERARARARAASPSPSRADASPRTRTQPGVEKLRPSQLDLTPQGRYRDIGHRRPGLRLARCPTRRFLKRSSDEARRARTPPARRRRPRALVEALGHFGVEARVDRHGRRPAHHPLRAAARARHQGRQGRPAQGRPRLRARRVRHPRPRADPGQAGGRRRGPQRAPPDRPPRRRAVRPAARTGRR